MMVLLILRDVVFECYTGMLLYGVFSLVGLVNLGICEMGFSGCND